MKLLLFEFKKIIRTKTFSVFLLLTIVLIAGLFVRNVILQDTIAVQKIERFSEYASEVSQANQGDTFTLEESGTDGEIEARLEVGRLLFDQLSQLMMTIQNNQWKEELAAEIIVYNNAMIYKEMKGPFRASGGDMQETIRLNEELLALGLPKEDMDLSIQPTIFLKKMVSLVLSIAGFLAIVLVLGTFITREFEEHNMQMVYALPVSRTIYIVTKFMSLLISGFIWLIIVFSFSYLLPFLFGHFEGDIFNYPLSTIEGNYISTGEYIKQAILYNSLFMTFTVALLTALGFLMRNTILTYLTAIFLFIGSYIVLKSGWTAFLNPFTYQNSDFIILNEQGYYPFALIALLVAAVFLLALTIVFLLALTIVFKWKWGIAR